MAEGARHPDLITRAEAAALLGVSVSQLAHGWGPAPLPQYKRPVYYWRPAVLAWLAEGVPCSTVAAAPGGSNSSTGASPTASRRIREIEKQRRQRLGASGSRSSKRKALVAVPQG